MKTTFKQYLLEVEAMPKARSREALLNSIRGGKFTEDGSHLKIIGNCHFGSNYLISLAGSPLMIDGDFDCSANKLTSLEGAPTYVNGDFFCNSNMLSSLKDVHKQIHEINGVLHLEMNPIKSHVLGLLKIKKLINVQLEDFMPQAIINKYLPEGDIFACQQELIDAGLDAYAQM